MDEKQIRQLIKARDQALLSMDEKRIRNYFRKYNGKEMPADPEIFWRAVHKARMANRNLPMAARSESKRWLLAHGSQPLDDGDVP
jgi:hypothetical protein